LDRFPRQRDLVGPSRTEWTKICQDARVCPSGRWKTRSEILLLRLG
jgi:hypothetical protein